MQAYKPIKSNLHELGFSIRSWRLLFALFYFLFKLIEYFGIKKFNERYIKSVAKHFYCCNAGVFACAVNNAFYR